MDRTLRLGVHTLTHCAVDFSCFYLLYTLYLSGGVAHGTAVTVCLLYNAVAFGLQPLAGWIADQNRSVSFPRLGIAAVLVGLLLTRFPLAAVLFAAFGNALFHVGGGIDVLAGSDRRVRDAGIFVSSGALGVALGSIAGLNGWPRLIPFLLMAVCFLLQLAVLPASGRAAFGVVSEKRSFSLLLPLLLLAIALRAYVGGASANAFAPAAAMLLSGAVSCVGKASGGFLADRFGARRVSVLALTGAAVLFAVSSGNRWLLLAASLLFNMPMPVTLCAAADLFPNRPGFAFGLTTLALLLGTLPTYLFVLNGTLSTAVSVSMTVIAAVLLLATTQNRRKGDA